MKDGLFSKILKNEILKMKAQCSDKKNNIEPFIRMDSNVNYFQTQLNVSKSDNFLLIKI